MLNYRCNLADGNDTEIRISLNYIFHVNKFVGLFNITKIRDSFMRNSF